MNHGTDNQKILGNCPACQKLMQIPVVTDVASVAKCPHCQNQIRVRDLLASVVPEAEIIADQKEKGTANEPDYVADRQRVYDDSKPKTREKFEVPSQLYNGASRRNRKRRGGSRGSSSRSSGSSSRSRSGSNNEVAKNGQVSNSTEGSSSGNNSDRRSSTNNRSGAGQSARPKNNPNPTSVASVKGAATANSGVAASDSSASGTTVKPTPAPKLTPMPRPRKSSRVRRSSEMDDEVEFGLTDILKFLAGGVIAAPLAYLALLWVLGVDPFGMASTFESISPAMIPDAMRSENLADQPRSGFAPPAGESSSMLFGSGADEDSFDSDFEDDGLPLPTLDPDLVR